MRPMLALGPLLALGLAACQTPREACISQGSSQLRVIEGLIAETQGNLARGYAVEEDQEVRVRRDLCTVENDEGEVSHVFCDRTVVTDIERPVAVDLAAERRKLDSLLDQRAGLQSQQLSRAQQCVALYPE